MAIRSFADATTKDFFIHGRIRKNTGWRNISAVVGRKLDMMHYAALLSDLRSPPGNRLELLAGNLAGCHSIRINDQWRIVFRWTAIGPVDVRVCDYH